MLTDIPSWPASLQLSCENDSLLVCEKPLRNLPRKRLVCSGHWQGKPVVAKLFLDPHSAKRHWQREKVGVAALQETNITTPSLLFSGQLNDQTPVLIFEQLPGAETALTIWQKLTDDEQRLSFLHQLLSEQAAHHQAGLWQKDLHLNNFLYSKQRWYTIDADTINNQHAGTPLSHEPSLGNLALFFAQLTPTFDHLIEPALTEYARQRHLDLTELLNPLIDLLDIKRKQRRHKYIKKSYRTCSEFIRRDSKRQVAIYRRDANSERIQQLLSDPDSLITAGKILKDGNSATVTQIHHQQGDWVIKRYNIKNFWHGLKRCLRPSRAWVSWGNSHRLTISGIATPRAIAVIEKRLGPLRWGAYYVCEHIDAPDATDMLSQQPTKESTNSKTARQFVLLFSLLHSIGIHHGDCKATNFLVHKNQPYVIDLDAMREFRYLRTFLRHYKIDRERFLTNWKAQPQLQKWFNQKLPK